MKNYLQLLKTILAEGTLQVNRTGIDTLRIEGACLDFDLRRGFPLVTTRKIYTKQIIGELIGFIRACDNAADFRALGCTYWDKNANENKQWLANPHRKGTDDLGRIYGVQWRKWQTPTGEIDQLKNAVNTILTNPQDRRIIVNAWNPGDLPKMALPPCHLEYQFIPDAAKKELSLTFVMRSIDTVIGLPSNIASYAALLELVAAATGYTAKKLVVLMSDVHIYVDQIENLQEQLIRQPQMLPSLVFTPPIGVTGIDLIDMVEPKDFNFINYKPHPAIKFDMAV